MQILKVITQIITSKAHIVDKESMVYDIDDVHPKISISLSRYYPPDLQESLDITFELFVIFPNRSFYIFECKDQIFYDNQQKRPDEDLLFSSVDLSLQRIGWILNKDCAEKGLLFIHDKFSEINLLEIREDIRKALNRAYT